LAKTPVMSVYFSYIRKRLNRMRYGRPLPALYSAPSGTLQPTKHPVTNPVWRWPSSWIVTLFLRVVLLSMMLVCTQNVQAQEHRSGIIVLDPGHGGNDIGARGPDNMTEKQVAMTFVAAMTQRLKKTYQVVLTRKDDYQVDVFERPALANHLKADLFVSIHTGGSFRSHPRGMSVLYYDNPPMHATASEKQATHLTESSSTIGPWDQNRPEQIEKSRNLSELITKHLTRADKDLKLTRSGVPLIVMSGADMPAVMIEIGYITNPLDAKGLNDDAHVTKMARVICDAIDDFFSNKHRL
jgi:N-acetylmuramoyl-L-alanine amidase